MDIPLKETNRQNLSSQAELRQSASTPPFLSTDRTSSSKGNDHKLLTSSVEKPELDEEIWKEQASEPEDLESVIRYLQQVIADNQ
jgi:hypothetical protein